jgi:hypothetical protein
MKADTDSTAVCVCVFEGVGFVRERKNLKGRTTPTIPTTKKENARMAWLPTTSSNQYGLLLTILYWSLVLPTSQGTAVGVVVGFGVGKRGGVCERVVGSHGVVNAGQKSHCKTYQTIQA